MIEPLILYETAKLAKIKGFEIQTHLMFATTGQLEPYNDFRYKHYRDYCMAPTQALLQKWLREQHKIQITVHSHKTRTYNASVEDELENWMWDSFGEFYNNYEEALEYALQGALKAINKYE